VWSHFAYPVTPADPIVTSLTPGYAADHNIGNLLRAVLLHPMFVSPTARSGLVKQPIEWVVGSLRVLGLPATDPRLVGALTQLGQVPFRPPNVGGWPQNGYWLSTATSLARLNIATVMAGAYHGAASPAALASLLSVDWSPTTAAALASASDPTSMLALALCSPEWVLA
jgi:uncharacterized protein (DUF1800 family)